MKNRLLTATMAPLLLITSVLMIPATARPSDKPSLAESSGIGWLGWTRLPHAHDVATTRFNNRVIAAAINFGPTGSTSEMRIIDITDPAGPATMSVLKCGGSLSDITETKDPRLLAVMVFAKDDCLNVKEGPGLVLVDIAHPGRPAVVAATELEPSRLLPRVTNPWPVPVPVLASHPSAPYVYTTRHFDGQGELLAWKIDRSTRHIGLAASTSIPGEPRDIDIHEDGTTLALAIGHAFATVDLADPAAPRLTYMIHCPGCFLVSEVAFAGRLGLVVSDESPNTIGCPSGHLFFYTIELGIPQLYSIYNPSRVEQDPEDAPFPRQCTTDDLTISSSGEMALLTWHRNSTRLLYIESAFGVGTADIQSSRVTEMGWFRLDRAWSEAARFIDDRHLISLDQNWGVQTLKIKDCAFKFEC